LYCRICSFLVNNGNNGSSDVSWNICDGMTVRPKVAPDQIIHHNIDVDVTPSNDDDESASTSTNPEIEVWQKKLEKTSLESKCIATGRY